MTWTPVDILLDEIELATETDREAEREEEERANIREFFETERRKAIENGLEDLYNTKQK